MPPFPSDASAWAVFLDFDGTLVELAPTPDAITVPAELPILLADLSAQLGGALAIVSGRPIGEIDAFLAPTQLPAAGQHGLERRDHNGEAVHQDAHLAELSAIAHALDAFAETDSRLLVEKKSLTAALHFRNAPDREADCRKLVQKLAAQHPTIDILSGKMVFEARGHGMDKGQAIASFMDESPFESRVPVMVGDDTTDEDGFRVANELGGHSIKVGAGATLARNRLGTVSDVLNWLNQLRDSLS